MTAERIAPVLAERDAIQANLLELDGSFVRQLLDGAALAGQTRQRWTTCTEALARLWETYLAYSAVVDRIAQLGGGVRGPARKDLPELDRLLAGPCVLLPAGPVPLGHRDLTATGNPPVTLATAVQAMRGTFAEVTTVTAAVEAVWAALDPALDAAAAELSRARSMAAGLGGVIEGEVDAVQSDLDDLRAAAKADPLAMLTTPLAPATAGVVGSVDTSAAGRLREQAAELAGRVAELDRLRSGARQRLDALAASVAAARAARQDAIAAWHRAKTRVTAVPALPPAIAEPPLATLAALVDGGGRWDRLRAELDRCEAELAAAAGQTRDLARAAAAAVGRRDELRGLLDAYKAKAARLGAAESVALAERYDQAHDLLWTAPCDLAAAQAAVTAYQRAILTQEGRR